MFCYQVNIATKNLMDPTMVDSSSERTISDSDMPLITVCPTNQNNKSVLKEFGYKHIYNLLMGDAQCNETTLCTSWGSHLNLTFDELKNNVFSTADIDNLTLHDGQFNPESVFIPGYGLCKETSFIDMTKDLELEYENLNDVRVLITDRNYRSYVMPDISSHVGSKIFLKPQKEHFINVQVHVKSNCDKDQVPMTRGEFEKCYDEKIQRVLEQFNDKHVPVPPWLTNNTHHNQTYSGVICQSHSDDFRRLLHKYILRVVSLDNIFPEIECRQSCEETTFVVNEREVMENFGGYALIEFNQKVAVTKRLPNYDMFKYIIDVGSSLGLWLGLSVLSLHDLVVIAVQFINNNFMSAVSK